MKPLSALTSKIKVKNQVQGFSIIEVAVSMVILGTTLAYAMPVILQSKISTNKSQVRAGAMAVSQKIFDNLRGKRFASIPDTEQTDTQLTDTSLPSEALGRKYNVYVLYCEKKGGTPANGSIPAIPGVSECTSNYRTFKITVRDTKGDQTKDQSIIYEMEAAFTDFK
jgi:prepilin-type N-terminal cleavage/methylation domain-containing protein